MFITFIVTNYGENLYVISVTSVISWTSKFTFGTSRQAQMIFPDAVSGFKGCV